MARKTDKSTGDRHHKYVRRGDHWELMINLSIHVHLIQENIQQHHRGRCILQVGSNFVQPLLLAISMACCEKRVGNTFRRKEYDENTDHMSEGFKDGGALITDDEYQALLLILPDLISSAVISLQPDAPKAYRERPVSVLMNVEQAVLFVTAMQKRYDPEINFLSGEMKAADITDQVQEATELKLDKTTDIEAFMKKVGSVIEQIVNKMKDENDDDTCTDPVKAIREGKDICLRTSVGTVLMLPELHEDENGQEQIAFGVGGTLH